MDLEFPCRETTAGCLAADGCAVQPEQIPEDANDGAVKFPCRPLSDQHRARQQRAVRAIGLRQLVTRVWGGHTTHSPENLIDVGQQAQYRARFENVCQIESVLSARYQIDLFRLAKALSKLL
ncbi:hypothetical protein [Deinococcus roseus]|uniref:hypothetical protein n=1 Tax=Deinococcus roseus TaxID=392414 RepID=UPI001663B5A6|nr:hypothetical protein [Deinococcus roseus]